MFAVLSLTFHASAVDGGRILNAPAMTTCPAETDAVAVRLPVAPLVA
jgi:hypothetical protein